MTEVQEQLPSYTPSPMTEREQDLLKTLRTHLTLNDEATFTVDTLRQLGFDRFMPKDKLDRINYGTLIGKWKFYGYIEEGGKTVCSQLLSNHGHRVQVWKLNEKWRKTT